MSYVSDNRTGVRAEVTEFVTREDPDLTERLRRRYRVLAERCDEGKNSLARSIVERGARWQPGLQSARLGTICRESLERFLPTKPAASGEAPAAMAVAGRWLALRLRDAGMLAWLALRLLGRTFLFLPMALRLVFLTVLGLTSVMLWPPQDVEAETQLTQQAPRPAEAAGAPAETWRQVASPMPAYHLEAPELDRAQLQYRVRTQSDGTRQDLMIWSFAENGTRRKGRVAGALTLETYPRGMPGAETLFVELSRRAALTGASIERLGGPIGLETKFGTTETADATLLVDGVRRRCIGFRNPAAETTLVMTGWFCGTGEQPLDRAGLACLIDRIDLVSAGNAEGLRRYFAAVERARQPCGPARLIKLASAQPANMELRLGATGSVLR